jgi:hypothetical protein
VYINLGGFYKDAIKQGDFMLCIFTKRFLFFAALFIAFPMTFLSRNTFAAITFSGSGIQISIDTTSGNYSVVSTDPAWTFAGSLSQSLAGIQTTTGNDSVGGYQEVYFTYASGNYEGRIRVYTNNRAVVIFRVKSLKDTTSRLGPYFPNFTTYPAGLNAFGYSGAWNMARWSKDSIGQFSPAVFYDNSANTFIISAASDFMDSYINCASGIKCGLQNWPNDTALGIKNGYTHSTILVVGKGINAVFDSWGSALTVYQNKKRPPNDQGSELTRIGFWTDEQDPYWYSLNGFADYDVLLTTVKHKYDSLKIKIGYVQLDSWWYIKDPTNWLNRPGTYLYQPVPLILPNGLASLHQRLGLPFVTHNRWIGGSLAGEVRSPYRDQYTMSGGVSIDPAFWDKIIGDIKSWGVITYEQDWLNENAATSNIIGHGEKFMDEMARATNANGLTMQYCMPIERHYMQGSKYGNLTTIRTSTDRFVQARFEEHFFNCRFAKSIGAWPWVDNYQSNELGCVVLACLTGGMAGVADTFARIGDADRVVNILKTVRRDGLIVKPDQPMVPSDASFIRRSAGVKTITGFTYTQFANKKVVYVFDYANGTASYRSGFAPSEFGLGGKVYAYNYFKKAGKLIDAATAVSDSVANWNYYVLSPVGAAGFTIVGDTGKFVTCGINRIRSISETTGHMTLDVAFGCYDSASPDQKATIRGYSADSVVAVAGTGASAGKMSYDHTSGIFQFDFAPNGTYSGEAVRTVDINDPKTASVPQLTRTEAYGYSFRVEKDAESPRTGAVVFTIPEGSVARVNVQVFDIRGRLVATLVDRRVAQGNYRIPLVGRDERKRYLATGRYLCKFRAIPISGSARYFETQAVLPVIP